MKYCIIRRVPFKLPGSAKIVWAYVLAENEGLALIHVPKSNDNGPHSIFIAQENAAERVFQAVNPIRFDLETEQMKEAGDRLRMLGKSFGSPAAQRPAPWRPLQVAE